MAAMELVGPDNSIAHQAAGCQTMLQQLFEETKEDDWVGRQMAELNVWCAKLGVDDQGHRSIDFRLKDVPEMCDAIGLLLQSLRFDLERLVAAAVVIPSTEPQDPTGDSKSDGDSGDGNGEGSDTSSLSFRRLPSSEGSTDGEETAGPTPAATALRRHVEETLDRLHGLARQVQNAGSSDRRERIENYRRKPGPGQVYDLLRLLASRKLQHGSLFPRASSALKERIAESFARRRMRFAYLKAHQTRRAVGRKGPPDRLEATDKDAQVGRAPTTAPTPPLAGGGAAAPAQDLTAKPEDMSTLYTRTQNTKLQEMPEIRWPSRPESVASVTLQHHGFPKPPDVAGKISFECPYCRLLFPAREAEKSRWRYVTGWLRRLHRGLRC